MPTDTHQSFCPVGLFNIDRYTASVMASIRKSPIGGGPIEATERVGPLVGPLVWRPAFEGDDSVGVHNCHE